MDIKDLEPNELNRDIAIGAALKNYIWWSGRLNRHDYTAVVNLREPSYRKRLYVMNGDNIEAYHVAHGSGSSCKDKALVCQVSDIDGTHMSCSGAMMTSDVYVGKHGKSLRLIGLEQKINGNMLNRDIVIHSAIYMTEDYILKAGRAGQSWGCFAVAPTVIDHLIGVLKEGCFLYAYF